MRWHRTAAAAILLGVAVSLGVAAPASATPSLDVINLSPDGVVWVTSLAGGLFDSFQGAVPGDSVTKSFWVRNPTSSEVTMLTRAADVSVHSTQLQRAITVTGAAGALSLAAPVTLASLVDCSTLAPDLVVAPNAVEKVSITLAMLDVQGSFAQGAVGGFDVLLSMQDDAAGPGAASCDGSVPTGNPGGGGTHHKTPQPIQETFDPFGPLAFTGVDSVPVVFGALGLLVFGLLLLIVRRRRRNGNES